MMRIILLSWLGAALGLVNAEPNIKPSPDEPPPPTTQPAVDRSAADVLRIFLGDVSIKDAPLSDALEWLAQTADVNVFVNWNRLAVIGIEPQMPVSVAGQGLTVGDYLDSLMANVNRGAAKLGYEAGRNLIRIAARSDLDEELVTRLYPVYDLLRPRQGRPAQVFFGRVQEYVVSVDPFIAPGVAMPRPIIGRAGSGVFLDTGQPGAQYEENAEAQTERLAAALIAAVTGSVEPDSWEVNGGRGTISFYQGMLIVRNSNRVHRILGGSLTP